MLTTYSHGYMRHPRNVNTESTQDFFCSIFFMKAAKQDMDKQELKDQAPGSEMQREDAHGSGRENYISLEQMVQYLIMVCRVGLGDREHLIISQKKNWDFFGHTTIKTGVRTSAVSL